MKNYSTYFRKVTALVLLFSVGSLWSTGLNSDLASAKTKSDAQIIGQLVTSGAVSVNDKKAISGTSIFSNSRLNVACANGNRAVVNLGRLGRVELAPGSQMTLRFSDGMVSGDLVMGKVVVNTPAGVKVSINTPEGVSASDGKDASLLAVATQRGVRCVPVMMGQSNSVSNLSSGALAAILLGTGGVAALGTLVSNESQASGITP